MSKHLKILIVEDEDIEARAFEKLLRSIPDFTLEIYVAKTGSRALELFPSLSPDIVFMDINMPGISGLEAAKEIRTISKSVKIVMLSAYDKFSYAQEAIRFNALDYLVKPAKKNDIISILNAPTADETATEPQHMEEKEQAKDFLFVNTIDNDRQIAMKLLAHIVRGNGEQALSELDACYAILRNDEEKEAFVRMMWIVGTSFNNLPASYLSKANTYLDAGKNCKDLEALYEILSTSIIDISSDIANYDKSASDDVIELAKKIIALNYDKSISLEYVAKQLNCSVSYLTKKFKKCVGQTFVEYLNKYRMEKAKELLSSGEGIIKEIAYQVGFHSQSYFSNAFKKYTGYSPAEWTEMSNKTEKR